jgi:hypothetical protein
LVGGPLTYRADDDALRARLRAAEAELARAEGTVARLRDAPARAPDLALATAIGRFVGLVMPGIPVMAALVAAGQHGMLGLALHGLWMVPAIVVASGVLFARLAAREADLDAQRRRETFERVIELARSDRAR